MRLGRVMLWWCVGWVCSEDMMEVRVLCRKPIEGLVAGVSGGVGWAVIGLLGVGAVGGAIERGGGGGSLPYGCLLYILTVYVIG